MQVRKGLQIYFAQVSGFPQETSLRTRAGLVQVDPKALRNWFLPYAPSCPTLSHTSLRGERGREVMSLKPWSLFLAVFCHWRCACLSLPQFWQWQEAEVFVWVAADTSETQLAHPPWHYKRIAGKSEEKKKKGLEKSKQNE